MAKNLPEQKPFYQTITEAIITAQANNEILICASLVNLALETEVSIEHQKAVLDEVEIAAKWLEKKELGQLAMNLLRETLAQRQTELKAREKSL